MHGASVERLSHLQNVSAERAGREAAISAMSLMDADGIESFGHENCDMERIAAARRCTSQSRVLLESLVLGLSLSLPHQHLKLPAFE